MSAPVKLPFAMSAEVMELSRMSAEATAPLAIFAEVTAPSWPMVGRGLRYRCRFLMSGRTSPGRS